jgi:hypothetical protein
VRFRRRAAVQSAGVGTPADAKCAYGLPVGEVHYINGSERSRKSSGRRTIAAYVSVDSIFDSGEPTLV